jgi:3-hydroxyacyl-CoA dehydrogenase
VHGQKVKVAVIGSGVMGPGIAQTWLLGGCEVALADLREEALEAGVARIKKSISLLQEKNLAEKEALTRLSFLRTTTSLAEAVKDAGLVIECVAEDFRVKSAVYAELDKICPPEAVIVSNTSALPLPDLLPHFRPDRFFICHYFNPPEIIPLVEIVTGPRTGEEAVAWLRERLREGGKVPVVVRGFKPGFLVNRLQTAMLREAFHLVKSGIVRPEDIDAAVTACIGFKSAWQGLFETMDYIGLDTVALACSVIFPDLSGETAVPEIITQKVREGNLGAKSGKGFFNYAGERGAKILEQRYASLLEQLVLWKKTGAGTAYSEEGR